VGGVLPVLVQHHYIRNRQRVSLEICRMPNAPEPPTL